MVRVSACVGLRPSNGRFRFVESSLSALSATHTFALKHSSASVMNAILGHMAADVSYAVPQVYLEAAY